MVPLEKREALRKGTEGAVTLLVSIPRQSAMRAASVPSMGAQRRDTTGCTCEQIGKASDARTAGWSEREGRRLLPVVDLAFPSGDKMLVGAIPHPVLALLPTE